MEFLNMRIIEKEEVFAMEPNVSKEVVAALYAPTAGVTGPWEVNYKNVGKCSIEWSRSNNWC